MSFKKNNEVVSVLFMILSTTSFTLSGLFSEMAIRYSNFWIALIFRFIIPFLFVFPIYFIENEKFSIRKNPLHIFRAFFLVSSQSLFFITVCKISLFQAIVLYNTGPFFLVFFDCLYFKKKISMYSLFGVLVGFVGVVVTINHSNLSMFNNYYLIGVLSGVFFSLSQFTLYLGSKNSNNIDILFHTYFYGSIFSLIPAIFMLSGFEKIIYPRVDLFGVLYLLLMGSFSLANQWFRGVAYRYTDNLSMLAPVLYFGVVASGFIDYIFNEKIPTMWSIYGALLIVSGAILPNFYKNFARRKNQDCLGESTN